MAMPVLRTGLPPSALRRLLRDTVGGARRALPAPRLAPAVWAAHPSASAEQGSCVLARPSGACPWAGTGSRRHFAQKAEAGGEEPQQEQQQGQGRPEGSPSEADASPAADTATETLAQELAKAQEQLRAKKNELLLALADFENNKKRFEKEREQRKRGATVNFAKKMVEVYGEFETLKAPSADCPPACQSLHEGVVLVRNLYRSTLQKFGVEPFGAERGQPIVAARHEIVGAVEDTELPSHSVAEVVREGLVLEPGSPSPAVLRKAQVKAARHGPEAIPR